MVAARLTAGHARWGTCEAGLCAPSSLTTGHAGCVSLLEPGSAYAVRLHGGVTSACMLKRSKCGST
eukprot:358585-Chlamydomonas_euryale.AAC.3